MHNGPPLARDMSIVVLTYNRCDELRQTLDRLKAAVPDVPLVVVDNASTDSTAACVAQRFPDVKLVRAPSNLGAAGRNLGLQAAATKYVAFCDDDVCWRAGALHRAQDILERYDNVAALNARVLVGPSAATDSTCSLMAASPLDGEPDVGPALTGFMAGACVVRSSAFQQVGGYWSGLFIGGEESLLALDLMERGWRILYAPELAVWHNPSPLRDSVGRERLLARNALVVAWMRLSWRDAARHTWHVLANQPGWHRRQKILQNALHHYWLSGARRQPVSGHVTDMLRQVRLAQRQQNEFNRPPYP